MQSLRDPAILFLVYCVLAGALLLMVLSASASYIVVPAVLRYAIPEANPALYFGLSLGVTFPFNILIGYRCRPKWRA